MNRRLITSVASLVIFGALFWIYHSRQPRIVELKGESYDRLAQLAAVETSKLLGNHGTVVVVQWDATAMGIPRYDRQIAQFGQQAGQHGVKVAGVEAIKLKRGGNQPAPRFTEIVRQHAAADAIVIFGGAYGLRVSDLSALPGPHPRLISVIALDGCLKKLLQDNLIALAIAETGFVPERHAVVGGFVVLTPADAVALPEAQPGMCE